MSYTVLDEKLIPGYLEQIPRVMEVLGTSDELAITEIGDGNLNFVFRVARADDTKRSVILKQAVPYLRVEGEGWPLSRDRILFETRALRVYNDLVPQFVPEILHDDAEMSVLVMQDLGAVKVLRYPMIEGVEFPGLGTDIGKFLGETLFKTSTLGMESIARRRLMQDFNLNDELCKLTEEFIFTFPYVDHPSNYKNPPTNAHALNVFRNDPEYLKRILRFKELFLTKSDALLHGDLHTGSLMVEQNETYVIDVEFAFFGPFGFDVGKIIANFLMAYTSHFHRPGGPDYQAWLLNEAVSIWKAFEAEFLRLWDETPGAALYFEGMLEPADLADYKKRFMQTIFDDAMGFCACSVARRTVGLAGVADVRAIEDLDIRTHLECMNVDLSHWIMMQYDEIGDIDSFKATVTDFYSRQAPMRQEERRV